MHPDITKAINDVQMMLETYKCHNDISYLKYTIRVLKKDITSIDSLYANLHKLSESFHTKTNSTNNFDISCYLCFAIQSIIEVIQNESDIRIKCMQYEINSYKELYESNYTES